MTLVQIFLRGGCDTLSLIPPIDGPDRAWYEQERPNLKIPITGDDQALRLTDMLGMHPAAQPLHQLYQAKKLAVIQATGIPLPTRSHFDAQAFVETGAIDKKGPRDGWLGRFLTQNAPPSKSAVEAVAIGASLPTSLFSFPKTVVVNNLGGYNIGGGKFQRAQSEALRRMYASSGSAWLDQTATETLNSIDELEKLKGNDYSPKPGVTYPKAEIGNRLKTLAQILKAGLSPQVISIDMGGWDTHKNQGNNGGGTFAKMVEELSQAIAAFYDDTDESKANSIGAKVRMVVMTEFGRRLKENGSGGTDHGHGSFMLVMGEKIRGGRVFGSWPGLANENLFERADLQVTTDYRQVLSEVVLPSGQLLSHAGKLFPGFQPKSSLQISV
jgi:uncharacterized protein (DUF1501 family)